ncbi:hypothetical protein VTN00DRAFT_262 [Thermoascus crustaceus]|uniref:uncharacterized protein n=1 Tax=Thermoascus crustaceus TaxID=5088 RepID=UPI003743B4AB
MPRARLQHRIPVFAADLDRTLTEMDSSARQYLLSLLTTKHHPDHEDQLYNFLILKPKPQTLTTTKHSSWLLTAPAAAALPASALLASATANKRP